MVNVRLPMRLNIVKRTSQRRAGMHEADTVHRILMGAISALAMQPQHGMVARR
jgi:hypothetical protein